MPGEITGKHSSEFGDNRWTNKLEELVRDYKTLIQGIKVPSASEKVEIGYGIKVIDRIINKEPLDQLDREDLERLKNIIQRLELIN